MQNEEMAPCATGELASVRSSVLALWRPFESFGLVWELSLSATCISDELAVAVTVGTWLLLKNLSTGKKLLNCCSTLQFYFFFSMYKTPKLQPCFPCCMVMKRPSLEGAVLVLLQRNLGEKTVKWDFFFSFSLHATTGLALWRSSSLTICSELWAWNFDTECCENRANVHTQILVWNFADF